MIAIDTKTNATGATPAKTLTLELTPFQTEAMCFAQNMGGIEFTLRSIVPETENDNSFENDLEGGLDQVLFEAKAIAKLGGARDRRKQRSRIARDSWTVERDLLFGRKGNTRDGRGPLEGASAPSPKPVIGKKKGGATPVNNVLPAPKGEQISIVRLSGVIFKQHGKSELLATSIGNHPFPVSRTISE